MSRSARAVVVAFAVGAAGGCGIAPQKLILDPARYATTCAAASECVPVWVGNVCAICTCPNLAISRSSLAMLEADVTGLLPWCADPGGYVCGACQESVAVCDAGQCALELH